MTMKSVDLPHLRSVVLAGHVGSGKTTLAEQLMFKAGAIPRLGQRGRWDRPPRLRARGAEAPRVAEPRGRHVRARRDADLAGRHARLPGLHRRRHRRLRRGRRRDLRHGRLGRRRGGARARPSRSAARPAPPRASSSTSATARTPTRPRRSTRCGRRSATRSRRSSWPSARPTRSAATWTSSTARRSRWDGTTEVEIPIPDDMADEVARRRDQLLEAASEADDDVLTKYLEGEDIADHELEAVPAQGRQGQRPRAGPRRQRGQGHRAARAARRDRPLSPLPGRRAAGHGDRQGRRHGRGRGRRGRAAPRPRLQDDGGPVRRPADVPARHVGDAQVAGPRLEHHPRRGRADRPAAPAPRQGAGADRRAQGRRDRRRREARRDRDRRHASATARSGR